MVLMITRDIRRVVTTGDHTDSQGEDRVGGSKHYYIPLATNDRLFRHKEKHFTLHGLVCPGQVVSSV